MSFPSDTVANSVIPSNNSGTAALRYTSVNDGLCLRNEQERRSHQHDDGGEAVDSQGD